MVPARDPTDMRLIFLLWLAGLGAAAQYGKVSVIFDRLGDVYPDAGPALGFTVSLVGFVGIVLGIVAGLLVARIGYRRALVWALLAGALVSLYQATLPPLTFFLASRVVEGMSHLAIVVAAPTLIALISSEARRGFTLTLWGTFFGVAFTALVWLGIPLVNAFGVSALFIAHAVYMAGFAVVLAFILPAPNSAPPTDPLSIGLVLKRHAQVYRSAFISAPAIGWLSYTLSYVSILTLIPPYIDPDIRVLVVGAMPLVSIFSSLTLGVRLLSRVPAVTVIQMGFAFAAFFALLLVFAPGNAFLCIALAAALGLVQGAGFAAVPELNRELDHRAQANGALAQTGNIGNTLGTPLLLMTIGLGGYPAMMLTIVAILAAGIVAQWLLARRRQRAIA